MVEVPLPITNLNVAFLGHESMAVRESMQYFPAIFCWPDSFFIFVQVYFNEGETANLE